MITKWFLIVYATVGSQIITLIEQPLAYYTSKSDCVEAGNDAIVAVKDQLKAASEVNFVCLSNSNGYKVLLNNGILEIVR